MPFDLSGYSKVPSAFVRPATPSPVDFSPFMNSPSGAISTYLTLAAGLPSSNLIEPFTVIDPGSAGWRVHSSFVGVPPSGRCLTTKQVRLLLSPGFRHQFAFTAPGVGRLNVSGCGSWQGNLAVLTNNNSTRRFGRQALCSF